MKSKHIVNPLRQRGRLSVRCQLIGQLDQFCVWKILQPVWSNIRVTAVMLFIGGLHLSAAGLREPTFIPSGSQGVQARPSELLGVVSSEDGTPLVGATVVILELNKKTLTNTKGEFSFSKIPDGNYKVEVTFVGLEKYQTFIQIADNPVRLMIKLKPSSSKLDEVQVVAYGTSTQRLNTGSVTTVTAKEIEQQPVTNPLLALVGRVPGLFITQTNGFSGGGVTALIQGQNSISNGNDPFYVIDGVPYTSELLPSVSGVLGTSGINIAGPGNPLSFINPADIESISILKDASATAIYGSRAANGAILITTKKGKSGRTKVDINLQDGWGVVTRKLKLLNTPQFLAMRHEAINNDGLNVLPTDYDINGFWDTTRYTDWQKKLIGSTAQYANLNATLSGGNSNSQYLVGGTYHRETTVFPGDFANQTAALHLSINSVSASQKFRFQLSGSYLINNNRIPNNDITSLAVLLAPTAPPLYNKDGSLDWAPNASGTSTFSNNPMAPLYNHYLNKTNNLLSNMLLSYRILPDWEVRCSFGYNNLHTAEVATVPLTSNPPELRQYIPRIAEYGNNDISSWIVEPQMSYNKLIGKGKTELLLGSTIQQNNSKGDQVLGLGYNSDNVLNDMQAAASIYAAGSTAAIYKYNALFGRLNFNWADKYVVSITSRKDGSSRFGPANRFHNFGAVGAAWIVSGEPFFQKLMPAISFAKLRMSYGTTGNDQIGDYRYLTLYNPVLVGVPYQQSTGVVSNSLPNPFLKWEETRKLELGMDLSLLKERVSLNLNYFRNRSSNQLLNYALPVITGTTSISENFPSTVQNSGWEFTLKTINIKAGRFAWTSSFNFTVPQNKLLAFPGLAASSYASQLIIGKPITILKVYRFLGVDPATGLYQFDDGKKGITTQPDTNTLATKNVLINTSPVFYGGFQNNFSYKGIELDLLFSFVRQKGRNYSQGNNPGTYLFNQPVSVLQRWQKPGDITSIQRFNSDNSLNDQFTNATFSDAAYSNASYVRLKNLSLSWSLPVAWCTKIGAQNIRVYLQGQNLLTFTRYTGLDPETLSSSNLPPLRVLTFGIQAGL